MAGATTGNLRRAVSLSLRQLRSVAVAVIRAPPHGNYPSRQQVMGPHHLTSIMKSVHGRMAGWQDGSTASASCGLRLWE